MYLIYPQRSIYSAIWFVGIGFAVYQFLLVCQSSDHTYQLQNVLEGGFLSKNLYDSTDFEWQIYKKLFTNYWYLYVMHVFLTNAFIVFKKPQYKLLAWILISFYAIYTIFSAPALLLILINVIMLILLSVLGKNVLSYVLCFGVIIASQSTNIANRVTSHIDQKHSQNVLSFDEKRFLFTVCLCFLSARGLSSSLDNLTLKQKKKLGAGRSQFYEKILVMGAYLLYLPGFFTGPIYLYTDFERANKASDKTDGRLGLRHQLKFTLLAIKVAIYEYLLHWFYSSAALSNHELIVEYDAWQFAGFVISLLFLYVIKYNCIYGTFDVSSTFDGLTGVSPPLPLTNESIHLTSQLWRHFDPNVYKWLREYISRPIVGQNQNKYGLLFAATTSFGCLALLHTPHASPLAIWFLLNVLCSTFEIWACILGFEIGWNSMKARVSYANYSRLLALVCLPVFGISLISNLFYITPNFEIVLEFKRRICSFNYLIVLWLLTVFYCGSKVALDNTSRRSSHRS